MMHVCTYIRSLHAIFGRETTTYTVIYDVYDVYVYGSGQPYADAKSLLFLRNRHQLCTGARTKSLGC